MNFFYTIQKTLTTKEKTDKLCHHHCHKTDFYFIKEYDEENKKTSETMAEDIHNV